MACIVERLNMINKSLEVNSFETFYLLSKVMVASCASSRKSLHASFRCTFIWTLTYIFLLNFLCNFKCSLKENFRCTFKCNKVNPQVDLSLSSLVQSWALTIATTSEPSATSWCRSQSALLDALSDMPLTTRSFTLTSGSSKASKYNVKTIFFVTFLFIFYCSLTWNLKRTFTCNFKCTLKCNVKDTLLKIYM